MNYKKTKKELINLINLFLDKKKSIRELQNYSWEKIDEFSDDNQVDIGIRADETESVFWFAIWQIQHLATEEHSRDGTLERELKITLEYLQNQKSLPPGTYGLPPAKATKRIITVNPTSKRKPKITDE